MVATSRCEPQREFIETQVRLGRDAMAIYQDRVDQLGLHVRYAEADTALAQYALANAQEQAALVKSWSEPDLLVLDDLFLARRIPEAAAELLQAVVHRRYKLRRSIAITSNRVVTDWGKYLKYVTIATTTGFTATAVKV